MKIQLRRFLLAVAIASGLGSSTLNHKTNAHDFPLRSVACPYADNFLNSTGTYCPVYISPPDVGIPPAPLAKTASHGTVVDEDASQFQLDAPSERCVETLPALAHNPFARGMCEEYAPYDLDSKDAHGLSGISGDDWNSSGHGRLTTGDDNPLRQSASTEIPSEAIPSEAELPVAIAIESTEFDPYCPESSCPEEWESTEITNFDCSTAIDVRDVLGQSLKVLDDFACVWNSELHDLASLEIAGHWLGSGLLAASHSSTEQALGLAEHLAGTYQDSIIPPLMYVLYTTTDGVAVVVPAEMARAWNVPTDLVVDSPVDQELAVDRELAALNTESRSQDFDEPAPIITDSDFRTLRSQFLLEASERLDWLGIRLLQAADKLSDWAEPQIANRTSASIW